MVSDAQPTQRATQVPVVDIVDDVMRAMDDLEQNLQAYEAVQQIVTADSLRAESHLPLLKRDSLSALLGVLNSSFGQRYAAARIAAAAAAGELRAATFRRLGGPLE